MQVKNHKLSEEEYQIICALRTSPDLKGCFQEMLDISQNKDEEIMLGDDAEEATVKAIHKTGQTILQEWLKRRAKQAETQAAQSSDWRVHEKKSSPGKPLLEKSA